MQINGTPIPKPRITKRLVFGLAPILFILAMVLAYVFYFDRNAPVQPTTYKKGLHNQAYSELSEYQLDGNLPSTGISFSKPVDYKIAFAADDKTQAAFTHSLKAPKYAPLGSIFVSIVPGATSKEGTDLLSKSFSKEGTNEYKAATDPLQKFVVARFSPLYDIKYSAIRSLPSDGTKKIWAMELSALPKTVNQTDKAPAASASPGFIPSPVAEHDTSKDLQSPAPKKDQASPFENYKGNIIFIVGKNASYYLLVYNTDYNWDNNAKIWDQMIGSIEIDR